MGFIYLFIIGAVGAILLHVYLLRTKKRWRGFRNFWLSWIPVIAVRRRRRLTSSTPPRSLSPAKTVSPSSPLGFYDAFPPSGRPELVTVGRKSGEAPSQNRFVGDIDQASFEKSLIPFTANFATCGPSTYTPTRLAIGEIKALGDFPDYAGLSGVPLPAAYKEFRIETAVPRPYRPLRWAYHQTMCMLNF